MEQCRPPLKRKEHRMKPSKKYFIRCEGCGYYFSTPALKRAHKKAFENEDR